MFISTDLYLKRIMHTLEQVVAPEIESDNVRGQVFAIIDLIKQFTDRIEYKQSLITQEIDIGHQLIKRILNTIEPAGCPAPEELRAFLKELDEGAAARNIPLRNRVDEMFCVALNLFHDNSNKLDAAAAKELDAAIREGIMKIAGRDLGLLKPPMIEKISRSKR
jgi:hypothetical protein